MEKINERKEFIDKVIESLEKGVIPWEKPWETNSPLRNPVTGTEYKGANNVRLLFASCEKGYVDPRWSTYKQAKEKDWQVRAGEKATGIEFYSLYDKKTKKELNRKFYEGLSPAEKRSYAENIIPIIKKYSVFNGEQMENMPPLDKRSIKEKNSNNKRIEKIINNSEIKVNHLGTQAYYEIKNDTIVMPPVESFKNKALYYGTLLHEVAHATGHESRLDRFDGIMTPTDRAKEELRAEFASVFAGQQLGVDKKNQQNSIAYLANWAQMLKKDHNILFTAAKEAVGITDFIKNLEKGKFISPTKEKTKKLEIEK